MAESSEMKSEDNRSVFDEFKKMITNAKLSPNMGKLR